jgi:hypothetical protein
MVFLAFFFRCFHHYRFFFSCLSIVSTNIWPLNFVGIKKRWKLQQICNSNYHGFFKNHVLKLSCMYAWPHTWRSVIGMLIMPLRLMYILKLLYAIRFFKVMTCLGFQLCWRLYKRPSFSLLLLVFLELNWKENVVYVNSGRVITTMNI